MEQTLMNIKPDAVVRNLIGEFIKRVEEEELKVVALSKVRLERTEAEAFYAIHKDKPFFNKLCDYICSGPCVPVVIEGENAIERLRNIIGVTNPMEAEKDTIRGVFGIDETKNSIHASDSIENAKREINFFFSNHTLFLLSR
ncbi:MAG: nucleoside-diphosphate kinase [bacterium]